MVLHVEASSRADALALLSAQPMPDGAVLDLNLDGETALPVADVLVGRGVPVIFTAGFDAGALPERFAHVPRCEKPLNVRRVAVTLGSAILA